MNDTDQSNQNVQYMPPAKAKIEWFAKQLCLCLGQTVCHPDNIPEHARELGDFITVISRIYAKHYHELQQ